jgi:hypothetical protein
MSIHRLPRRTRRAEPGSGTGVASMISDAALMVPLGKLMGGGSSGIQTGAFISINPEVRPSNRMLQLAPLWVPKG